MKLNFICTYLGLFTLNLLALPNVVRAADFALSPDGGSVVRLVPLDTVAANSINTSLFPSGWSATSGTGGITLISSYQAGYSGLSGGAEIQALFQSDSALPSGSYLEWVQVLNTNLPLGGNTSPYLDNAFDLTKPFYSLTVANTNLSLPSGQLNFYDYSKRGQPNLATTNPITWNANLYPVVASSANVLTVYDGVSWGWTMKPATVGQVTGNFTNPQPSTAITTGVGTSNFTWGTGDPSSLTFVGEAFDTTPDTVFKLGTLIFRNGTIPLSTGADSVDFNALVNFTNIPEKNFTLTTPFTLVNTLNTSDPIASADFVSLDNFGFTFNVLEGSTASVNILAKLSTGLAVSRDGTSTDAALRGAEFFDAEPSYNLTIVGLSNASPGGFITSAQSVPEPFTVIGTLIGGTAAFRLRRKLKSNR
jgi:hypothetical protein